MRYWLRALATISILPAFAPGAGGTELEAGYPEWIAERYCAENANKAACRASLKLSDLLGQTQGASRRLDQDGDGEIDQWAVSASNPRLARCRYHHPAHPAWDFDEVCFFTEHIHISAFLWTTHRVGVKNSNGFVLESKDEHGQPTEYTVNEYPARQRDWQGGTCLEVISSGEIFCLDPVAAPDAVASAPQEQGRRQGQAGPTLCRVYDLGPGDGVTLSEDEPCERVLREQEKEYRITEFVRLSGARTVVESRNRFLYSAFRIDGAKAMLPGIPASEDRAMGDCTFNTETRRYFCVAEGAGAEPLAAGEEAGWCLMQNNGGPAPSLLDHGPCVRSGGCAVGEASGEESCEYLYRWQNGRETRTGRVETMVFLEDDLAGTAGDGCLDVDDKLIRFCYSPTVFDPEEHWTLQDEPRKIEHRPGVCAWRHPDGTVDRGECALRTECPEGSAGCTDMFTWRDGRMTTVESAEDMALSIDGDAVDGVGTWWPDANPKCATSKATGAEFCFTTQE